MRFIVCDNLITELNKRKSKYQELDDKFNSLYRSESISSKTKLKTEKCLSIQCDEIKVDVFLINTFSFKLMFSPSIMFTNVTEFT
jgi:hypothetical protein